MNELSLDHVVIGVSDLEASSATWSQVLGRSYSWRGRHPDYGTANILFRLDNAYIELLALDSNASRTTPWTAGLAIFLAEKGDGIYALALQTPDVARSAASLREKGLAIEDPADGEGVDLDTGAVRHWTNARISAEASGGARCFVIEHRSPPDALPRSALTVPAEAGVVSLPVVGMETENIEAARNLWRNVFSLAEVPLSGGWRYDLDKAGLILRGGVGSGGDLPHRWSLVVLEVARLDAVRERLGVDYEEGHFLGKPGLLLSASGATLFLLEES